ncbi:MAG: SPFH/Band 7/PHB domain protein [Mollicutes bacterium]|nr:SPFH/Band 7/PHB domain protein [Mollicutes bacterium]MDD7263991.1 SPFH/Band 7/PHB domain protein [bacterium]MDY4979429.1 SPFH domain-containing protein [Candidatus Onthovivens sp.]
MEPWAIILIVFGVFLFIILLVIISNIRIVKQTNKYIIERFGGYVKTWGVGVHMLIPFIDRVAEVVSLKEQVKDFDPQPVITKDNVTMQIDTIVFYQVTDPKLYAYGVENPISAIEFLSSTTLRNIIGELDLDETLTSRDVINVKMRAILDEATDPWGIKVNRVELKNILPPKDIRDAMERQMRAEREKREKILLAEGEKQSAILIAEGNKESAILNAEAEKQKKIKNAEGDAAAIVAVKEAEAQGIIKVREAEAQGLEALKRAGVDEAVLKLKSYEALGKVAEGQATKLIIPSDLTNLASIVSSVSEIVKK